jgi:hypothetical protein
MTFPNGKPANHRELRASLARIVAIRPTLIIAVRNSFLEFAGA